MKVPVPAQRGAKAYTGPFVVSPYRSPHRIMASFSIRKVDGRYYARISEKGRSPTRKSWPLKTSQKITAQKRLTRLREAFDQGDWNPWEGGWLSPEPVPLSDAIDDFLDAKNHLRPRTQDTYKGILTRFEKELPPSVMLQDVTPEDLQSYIRNAEVSSVPNVQAAFLQVDVLPLEGNEFPTPEPRGDTHLNHLVQPFEIGNAPGRIARTKDVVLDR